MNGIWLTLLEVCLYIPIPLLVILTVWGFAWDIARHNRILKRSLHSDPVRTFRG